MKSCINKYTPKQYTYFRRHVVVGNEFVVSSRRSQQPSRCGTTTIHRLGPQDRPGQRNAFVDYIKSLKWQVFADAAGNFIVASAMARIPGAEPISSYTLKQATLLLALD